MGAETRSSVTPKPRRALHQQYLPPVPSEPRAQSTRRRRASTRASPRRAAAASGRSCAICVPRAAAGGLQGLPDRGTSFQGRAFQMLGDHRASARCPCTTWLRSAGRSRCSWPSRWPACSGSSAHRSRQWSCSFAAVLIGICFLPIPWSARAATCRAGRGPGLRTARAWPRSPSSPTTSGLSWPRCSCSA